VINVKPTREVVPVLRHHDIGLSVQSARRFTPGENFYENQYAMSGLKNAFRNVSSCKSDTSLVRNELNANNNAKVAKSFAGSSLIPSICLEDYLH
jgi:hypothetical protein